MRGHRNGARAFSRESPPGIKQRRLVGAPAHLTTHRAARRLVEGDELTTEPYGAGLPKDDTEFKEFVDGVLEEYKSGGGWAEAYDKWIGQYTGEQQDPPTMTLQEAIEATS